MVFEKKLGIFAELEKIEGDYKRKICKTSFGISVVINGFCYLINSDGTGKLSFIIPKLKNDGIDNYYDFKDFSKSISIKKESVFKDISDIVFRIEKKLDTKGSIYLVTDGKYTKIGATSYNVKKRLNELQTGNALELKIVYDYKVKNKISTECFLHNKFKDKRILGEWFDLSFKDIEYIIKNKPIVEVEEEILTSLEKEDINMCLLRIENDRRIFINKLNERTRNKKENEFRKLAKNLSYKQCSELNLNKYRR